MLTFHDDSQLDRRDFLRIGSLKLGGLSLPTWLAARAAAESTGVVHNRSVIFLFLHGGPSQVETFDPKMAAPEGIRSATGELQTTVPGMTFGGTFPKLARLADRVSVVRAFVTGDGNHDIKPIVGKHSFGANVDSVLSRMRGANYPETGMPRNIALLPRAFQATSAESTFPLSRYSVVRIRTIVATDPLGKPCLT